jgi:hypothetical protein
MIKLSKVLPIAALGIALTAGINNRAEAYAYAYSDLFVTDGVVTISTGGGITVLPASKSTAGAALGGSGTATNDAGSLADAAVAVGTGSAFPDSTTPLNNSWVLEGSSAGHKYSWADSQIISEQSATTTISTRQIAEGNTTDDTLASSNSETSSVTSMAFTVASGGGTFNFDFSAALNMLAEITSPHTGIQALASAKIEITIRDSSGGIVFNWIAGNADGTGVNELLTVNTFALTSSVSVITTGAQALNESGAFSVTSDHLAAGVYQLALTALVSEGVQAHAIPAPGILTLFGLGLVMLGFMQRRNKITTKLAA